MNENDLQQMKRDIVQLQAQFKELLIKYDIIAEHSEKTNPRKDSEAISETKIKEHLGDMSAEVLIQMAKSFEQDYDKQTQKDIEDLRKRSKDAKSRKEIQEFDYKKKQYELIQERLKELGVDYKPIANSSSSIKEITAKIKEHNAKYDESWNDKQKLKHKEEHQKLLDELRALQDEQ